jgi:broad specificity phosphatase PhoE
MIHEKTNLDIYLIRHGESVVNQNAHLIAGRNPETPLSIHGEEQAIKLGQKFQREGTIFDYAFTSPLIRSKQTAVLALDQMRFPVDELQEVPEIMEFSQGDWENRLRSDVYTSETLRYINTKGPLFVPPNGESLAMTEYRVSGWLLNQVLHNPDYLNRKLAIGVFSHAMVIKCLMHFIMGFNDRLIHRIGLGNTGVCIVRFNKDGWHVDTLNDTSHLQ